MDVYWVADRIESKDTPDIFFSIGSRAGVIELKRVSEWPKRPNTPIRLNHFTPGQKNFLRRHQQNTFLFLQVADEYFLLRGGIAAHLWGRRVPAPPTRFEIGKNALGWWEKKIDPRELQIMLILVH